MRFIVSFIIILSVLRFLSIAELVDVSDGIVEGVVVEKACLELKGRIYTQVRLQVLNSFKGEFPQDITFMVKGGKKGNLVYKVSGEPDFREGERVIVFLTRRGKSFRVKGMALGKFVVREKNGKTVVERENTEVLVWKNGRVQKNAPFLMEYHEFISLIKEEIESR